MNILIRGGHLIDPSSRTDAIYDLLLSRGKVRAIGHDLPRNSDTQLLDATGLVVSPGLIDAHTHLRDPGFTHRETLNTGSRAAAMGGYTSIVAMCNTDPPIDRPARVKDLYHRAATESVVNLYVMGSISRNRSGVEVADLQHLKQAGVVAFGDDIPIASSKLMWEAFRLGSHLELPFCVHCEDPELVANGRINEGATALALGLAGRPNVSEATVIARDIVLAELAGVHLHILHITTAESVEIVRRAKAKGVRVTAEVTPHHFTLTDEAVKRYGPNAVLNPPLRAQRDVQAIKDGLCDGTIDLIATDHAPHAAYEKKNVETANPGLIGLETAVAQVLQELVAPGTLTLSEALAKLTCAPAKLFGLTKKGTLRPGSDADVTIIDPNHVWKVEAETLESQSKNSPYVGWTLKGAAVATIVRGKIIMRDRKLASPADNPSRLTRAPTQEASQ